MNLGNCPARPRLVAFAVAACLLQVLAAHAQPTPGIDTDERNAIYLSPLLNIADPEDDPYTRAAPASTLDADHIDLLGSQNLDDALRTLPGVFTRDNVQNPGIAVNIRGLEGSGRVNMSLDGIRQGFRFTGHEAQGFVYVDTALLAGVDIERGVVSGAGGGGALSGRANFRTLGVDDVLGNNDFGGFIRLGYGSNKVNDSEALATGARRGDWAMIAALSRRNQDEYKNGDGERVPYTGQDLVSGLFKVEYKPNTNHRLNFGAVLYDNDFTANSYTQNIDSRQYSVNYALTPEDSDWTDLRVNLYRSDVTMYYERPPIPTFGDASGRRIHNFGNGFDLGNTSYFSDTVHMTYGVEYFHTRYDVINSATTPGRGVNGPGKSAMASIFTETAFEFGPASLIAGLRYDRFALKGRGSIALVNPVGHPGGAYKVDRTGGNLHPKITLNVQATDWLQPYVSWGKSQRAPTISETFVGGEHPVVNGPPQRFYPNPFLKPESMAGAEIGLNLVRDGIFHADDMLRMKLNYYRHKVQDYVTASSIINDTYFVNVDGTSSIYGIEIQGLYDAGFVFANVSYSDTTSKLASQINGFGAQSYQPDSVFSTTLGVRLLQQRLTLGARHFRTSRAFIGEINATYWGVSAWEPGYHLTDLFANYRFDSSVELRLNISNINDTAYNPALSTPPGVIANAGRGRTGIVQVRFNF